MALLAYLTSFRGLFVMDDEVGILGNPTIRHLWPLGPVLSPPEDSTIGGRPLLNLSFALNYALGGESTWGYHAVNLAIHLGAGLLLFALVRRTLLRTSPAAAVDGCWIAAAAAGLWLVHPLATGTVTYISQRAEAQAALFYLLALYSFARGAEPASRPWLALSAGACLCGLASKEVVVTAPIVILLYDRVFIASAWKEVWGRRGRYHLAMAATWLWLAWLMHGGLGLRNVGFTQGVSPWTYALTECEAVVRYCALTFWPHPLVFDYGPVFLTAGEAIPYAAVLLALVVGSAWLLARHPRSGFLAVCFFILLAPTSSVVPIAMQPIAENRAYLASAAVVILFVVVCHHFIGRRGLVVMGGLSVAALAATANRNLIWHDELTLWQQTVARRPQNPRAHNNLGKTLDAADRPQEAEAQYRAALRLDPAYIAPRVNLAALLLTQKKPAEAEIEIRQALQTQPDFARAHAVLGDIFRRTHRLDEALAAYHHALQLNRSLFFTHINLATVLIELNRPAEAVAQTEQALSSQPDTAEGHEALGTVFFKLGRVTEAIAQYEAALLLKPGFRLARIGYAEALYEAGKTAEAFRCLDAVLSEDPGNALAYAKYGILLFREKRFEEASVREREALRLDPTLVGVHANLSGAYIELGRYETAIAESQEALRIDPQWSGAHYNVGTALIRLGRAQEAVPEFEAELRLTPGHLGARNNLAAAFYYLGRIDEAIAHYEALLRLNPGDVGAKTNYGSTLFQAGRREEAVQVLRDVIRQQPGQLDPRRNLALMLSLMGRTDEAKTELEALLRLAPNDQASLEKLEQLKSK